MPSTVRFHRVLAAPSEKVYKAFLDPDAMAKWLPPNGFMGKVHEMNARSAAAIACRSRGEARRPTAIIVSCVQGTAF